MANLSDRINNLTFVPSPQSPDTVGSTQEIPESATVPDGWLEANGQAVSRTTYADLFALYGTTFGVGDGSTTFNLPGGSYTNNLQNTGDITLTGSITAPTVSDNIVLVPGEQTGQVVSIGTNATSFDRILRFPTSGANWAIGQDVSASNAFTVSNNDTLGANQRLTISTAGELNVVSEGLTIATTGKGITFTNGGGDILDWYEEDSVTQVANGESAGEDITVTLTRVGNSVTAMLNIDSLITLAGTSLIWSNIIPSNFRPATRFRSTGTFRINGGTWESVTIDIDTGGTMDILKDNSGGAWTATDTVQSGGIITTLSWLV